MTLRSAIVELARPGAPALIEASAGTGKTWTLVELVLDRVRSGAPIESILIVTFTDKATREMRARVRAALEAGARDEPTLAAALLSFDRAPISTIHAFCQRLLREHAFDGGRLFREERLEAAVLYSRALRAVLRRGLVHGDPIEPFLLGAIDVLGTEGLEETVLGLARERGEIEPHFDVVALRAALEEIAASVDPAPELDKTIAHAGTRGRALRGLGDLRRLLGAEPGSLPLGELFEWAARGDPPPGRWLEQALVGSSLASPISAVAAALSSPAPMIAAHVLPAVQREALEVKRALGALDYDDLLFDLRDALRDALGAGLRARVRARLRHVLVDEFQDTDPVQWEIFRTLFFDCDGARSLVLIGDPKQAIYSFRGADLRTYERAREEVRAADGAAGYLEESHRSSPAFVEALHRILIPTETESPFFTGHNEYPAPVRAARPEPLAIDASGAELAPITLFQLESQAGPLGVRATRHAHARAIALEIESLLKSPPQVLQRDGARRALRASDIYVLTRSGMEGKEVGQALGRQGVSHAFFKEDGLYETAEARDLLDVLRALAAPDDALLRARALLTPFFAVALQDLGALRTLPRTHPVLAAFFELAALAMRGELAPLLSALTDRAGLVRRELYLHASERRLTNYLHLSEVALKLGREEHGGLSGVVSTLAQRIEGHARGEDDEDVQRLESDRQAVQILTMHKSKGLEAQFVFLYGGFGRPRLAPGARRTYHASDGRRVAHVGPAPAAIEARIAAESREEDERLLYVAMTRARACLYLPYPGRGPGSTPGPDALTLEAPGPMGTVLARLAEIVPTEVAGSRQAALFRRILVDVDAAARGARGKVRAPAGRTRAELFTSRPRTPLTDAEIERLRARAAGAIVTSYTRMKGERARALDGGRNDDEDADLLALRGALDESETESDGAAALRDPGGAPFGVAVHTILEHIDVELVRSAAAASALDADPACAALAADALDSAGAPAEARTRALELTYAALRTPIDLPGLVLPTGLAALTRTRAEVPFLHPIPERAHVTLGARSPSGWGIERGYVRGIIDLLLEHEGRTFVVDWKTDRLADWSDEAVRAHVRASYDVQLRLYALAAARMPGLGGELAWNAHFGGVVYLFLRGLAASPRTAVFFARPSHDELAAWDAEMRQSDAPWGHPLGVERRGA